MPNDEVKNFCYYLYKNYERKPHLEDTPNEIIQNSLSLEHYQIEYRRLKSVFRSSMVNTIQTRDAETINLSKTLNLDIKGPIITKKDVNEVIDKATKRKFFNDAQKLQELDKKLEQELKLTRS